MVVAGRCRQTVRRDLHVEREESARSTGKIISSSSEFAVHISSLVFGPFPVETEFLLGDTVSVALDTEHKSRHRAQVDRGI